MANGIVLNIDTTKSEFQNPMVQLRQGDGNYQSLAVTLTSNGEPFNLTGWTTTFMGTTAGGFKIVDSSVTVTNALQGSFTYTPTKAWGQDQGEFKNAYFKFVKSDETASGASFRVNVLDAVDLTAEEAGDYISIVDQTISKLNGDLSKLQGSVDDLKSQNNAIKTTDNTWTGTNTFTNQINGSLATKIITTPTDLFTLTNGYYCNAGSKNTNAPADATAYYTIEVIQIPSNGFMRLVDHTGKSFWITKDGGSWRDWRQDADDITVMHLSGDETASGFKKFIGNIATTSDNSMINGGGNNGDLAMVKSAGSSSYLAVGNSNPRFSVRQSNNAFIYPTDTFTDMFTVDVNGIVKAGTRQDLVPLDKNVAHNAGNETWSGNKTFSDETSFNKLINGALKTRLATFTDFSQVATNMEYYAGNWAVKGGHIENSPVPDGNFMVVEVTPGDFTRSGKITVTPYDSATGSNYTIYYAIVKADGVINWKKLAKDDTVVHNTGTETVAGNKTFTGNNSFKGVQVLAQSATVEFPMWFGSKMKVTRFGNMVSLAYSQAPTQDIPIGITSAETVPLGFRPDFDWYMTQGAVSTNGGSAVKVTQNGNLSATGTLPIAYPHTMTATYFTSDAFPN